MCKLLLLSDPGSRRWFVPSGKSFFVNSREGQISAKAEMLVADRADQPWSISGPGHHARLAMERGQTPPGGSSARS